MTMTPADKRGKNWVEDHDFEQPFQENSAFDILKTLYPDSDANLELISDLGNKEIRSISIILFLADYLDMPEFYGFIRNVLKLKVSKDRKGRKEFLEGFRPLRETEDMKNAVMSMPGRGIR